ncbi:MULTISPECIES: NTP transferase domain-containing protein [unclassified Sphingomonas]|uniref:NTP transferase domain-containing protein n=1 Tax=unclassified Sphingomonas TaxID=196159 RepID=UPI0006FEB7AC|nr:MULTISPECIES: NTP transferase domain-containing protein [unclassified Sphingomonas]KQX20911.1 nucleotidyl transferase [Sphingomonas sp. Root1294]KQY68758.1 nucleotidyl transferase [Sphingomonas sp. Root50]KRB88164.1 nucleotidyl transferase [Sphingomonas sp. Root720]
MSRPERSFTAVVLAAQRAGRVDPLAEAHGLSHKCLVPIGGAPLIAHVACALSSTAGCRRIIVVVEPAMFPQLRQLLEDGPPPVDFVAAADNLADSVFTASDGIKGPIVVTTADNVLLAPQAVLRMVETLDRGADVTIAMATRAAVLGAHPEGQRRFYRFSDDEYSNCNLYAFAGRQAVTAAESFRGGGQFAKKPMRLVAAVGPLTVVLMLLGRLSLGDALARLGRRFGLRIEPVVLPDGAHAIDVDNERTWKVASTLLAQRRDGERPAVRTMARVVEAASA